MAKCFVCNKEVTPGTGVMLVKNDGKTQLYCSKKCDKIMNKLGRKLSKLTWVRKKKKGAKQ